MVLFFLSFVNWIQPCQETFIIDLLKFTWKLPLHKKKIGFFEYVWKKKETEILNKQVTNPVLGTI